MIVSISPGFKRTGRLRGSVLFIFQIAAGFGDMGGMKDDSFKQTRAWLMQRFYLGKGSIF